MYKTSDKLNNVSKASQTSFILFFWPALVLKATYPIAIESSVNTIITFSLFSLYQYMANIIYSHTIITRAQFGTGHHFVSHITMEYFYNPSCNKAIPYASFHLTFIGFQANKIFLNKQHRPVIYTKV